MSRVLYVRGTATAGQPLKHTCGMDYLRSSSGQKLITPTGVDYNASAAFNPATITGFQVWLKADALTGLNDGDAIASFTDSSGNNFAFTQGTVAMRPLYKTAIVNALPVVRFDGVNDYLVGPVGVNAAVNGIAGVTWFLVLQTTDVNNRTFWVSTGTSTGAPRAASCRRRTASGEITISGKRLDADANQNVISAASIYTAGVFSIESHRVNYAVPAVETRFNGTSVLSGTFSGSGAASATNALAVTLGARGDGLLAIDGDIAELLLYTAALSDADRRSVEVYLGAKYGITV